jgi:hypothetical protein
MNSPAYTQLSKRPADLQVIAESALVGVGMSRIWDNPNTRPVWTQGGKSMPASVFICFPPFDFLSGSPFLDFPLISVASSVHLLQSSFQ